MATYEEHQKLQKESEPTKRKAENGYDRWIMEQGLGHINTSLLSYVFSNQAIAVQPTCLVVIHCISEQQMCSGCLTLADHLKSYSCSVGTTAHNTKLADVKSFISR